MDHSVSDVEVRFKGQKLLTVTNGQLAVSGKNFPSDIENISWLMGILSDVLNTARAAQSPPPEKAVQRIGNVTPFRVPIRG